jgi:pSer/pThr/pTyr-binding forkhead associated (FHA) protein
MAHDSTRVAPRPSPTAAPLPATGLLRVLTAPDPQLVGRSYPLRGEETQLGRDSANTVSLNDQDISRFHALIRTAGDGHWLHDLQSTNGITVNGQRLTERHLLRTGDVMLLGSTTLEYTRS